MDIKEDVEGKKNLLGHGEDGSSQSSNGHPWMVYFTTFVSVCGSYEFGACVSPIIIKSVTVVIFNKPGKS